MADSPRKAPKSLEGLDPAIRMSKESHDILVAYIHGLVEQQLHFSSFFTRLENIDINYYLFKRQLTQTSDGKDNSFSLGHLEERMESIIETPVAVSQVDSIVSYFTDLYLSGYPTFGVVAPVAYQAEGEALEAIIDSHAIRGRWGREIILAFYDAAKYNLCGLGIEWAALPKLSIDNNLTEVSGEAKVTLGSDYINRIKSYDLYNAFWDYSKAPSQVAEYGEYIGYHEVVNATELKTESIILADSLAAYNLREAFNSTYYSGANDSRWFKERPIVTNALVPPSQHINWLEYANNIRPRLANESRINYAKAYLKTTVYIRIIPSEFKLAVPASNTPQVYKVILINGQHIIHIKRLNLPFNMLPIMLAQLTEDGFAYQTKSVVENAMPWQDATTELLNIRLASARRALSDRAIYNPDVLSPRDVNTKSPAAKIPMIKGLRGALADAGAAYKQIPFDDSGTASAISDMNSLLTLNEYLYGINSSRQGVFKKGNRTLGEYQDVQASSDSRTRVMALRLESQLFIPLKYHIKANILQFASPESFVKQDSNQLIEVDIAKLREAILDFKISDGLTPKSKIIPPEALISFIQFLASDPELGLDFDKIKAWAQIMSLSGVPNLKQYEYTDEQKMAKRQQQAAQAGAMAQAQNVQPSPGQPT